MKKKNIVFLGLGISGRVALSYFQKQGHTLIGVDKQKPILEKELSLPIFDEQEALHTIAWDSIDLLVKSPGIAWTHPLCLVAKKHFIPITSEIEIALLALQHKNKKLFAITGSNGKTTTALLTTHILNSLGINSLCVGNVGVPLLSCIDHQADVFIIELSSYQIEQLQGAVLDGGVILNITPNHGERYSSFEAYAHAKLRLRQLIKKEGGFFLQKEVAKNWGSQIEHELLPSLNPEEKMAEIFALRYKDGTCSHNFENFQAAFSLCSLNGISEPFFWQGVTGFAKPAHRLEYVREWRNITFINDSKATSVDAVLKALAWVTDQDCKVVLIAGGVDKGGSYLPWKAFHNKVEKIVLIGEAQERIAAELKEFFAIEMVGTLDRALQRAIQIAERGSTVILSPGCSSFDQYKSYEQRGEIFKQLVHELGEEKL